VYGGDENSRAQVRQFIAMLRRPAIAHNCAIVLMGHPSRDGLRSGMGYSGSTAWHNSVRARQYLTTPKADDGDPPDRALRTLSLHKSNNGEPEHEIALRWEAGRFVVRHGAEPADRLAAAKARFLEMLASYRAQGRNVSHKPTARNYAPTAFANDACGARFPRNLYATAMNALFDDDRLRVVMGPEGVRASKQSEMLVPI